MVNGKLVFAIDFDGTIAGIKEGAFPEIGHLRHGADHYIKLLYQRGHYIIINTCRSGKAEVMAQDFLEKHDIPYHLINSNLPELITFYKQDCRKISADVYIDDNCIFELPSWRDIYSRLLVKFEGVI